LWVNQGVASTVRARHAVTVNNAYLDVGEHSVAVLNVARSRRSGHDFGLPGVCTTEPARRCRNDADDQLRVAGVASVESRRPNTTEMRTVKVH
jgi:hypothetical protein